VGSNAQRVCGIPLNMDIVRLPAGGADDSAALVMDRVHELSAELLDQRIGAEMTPQVEDMTFLASAPLFARHRFERSGVDFNFKLLTELFVERFLDKRRSSVIDHMQRIDQVEIWCKREGLAHCGSTRCFGG